MRRAGAVAALVLAAGSAACVAPEPDVTGCAPADAATITAVQAEVDGGTLDFGGTATGDEGRMFVSAHLEPAEKDPHDDEAVEDTDDDKILTWLVVGDGTFQSVDEQARTNSGWPEADIDVRADGARTSRACVADYRAQASTTTTP